MLIGCASNGANSDKGSYQHNSINKAVHTGEIADFKLTGPENGFVTDTGFTFTWEEATNASSYSIEISAREDFYNDPNQIYLKEDNIMGNKGQIDWML